MRNIKFRVFTDGRMLNCGVVPNLMASGFTACIDNYESISRIDGDVMQFTGLKDKNGVEIYEGDILKGLVDCFEVSISGYFSSSSVGFGVNYSRDGDCNEFSTEANPFGQEKDFEVIGNIHENPELLQETK